jgi:ABC-type ATPase involved in cell division
MIELVDVRLDHPRGGTPLVSEANLKVAPGEVVLVVGAAGVGTSRLVAAALGEVPTKAGRIEVLGRDVGKLRRASLRLLRRRIGIVPQDLCLLDDRSAQLNVVLPLEIDGFPRTMSIARANEVLARLGLESEASMPVDCLPGSARQRVAVARALVRDPEVVLADHPTSLQDAVGADIVCSALAEAARDGAAVVILGRDPTLRDIAIGRGWRQVAIVHGRLWPLSELQLVGAGPRSEAPGFTPGAGIDELLLGETTAPTPLRPDEESIPNIVPFPLSARTAGVA